MYIMHKSSFFHVISIFVVIFYFSHYCFVFQLTLLSFSQLLPYYFASDLAIIQNSLIGSNCNNVFMLCKKYNTCILTTVLMYYTIFVVAVPYSLDLFISSSSLLCKTCMLLFALLAVTSLSHYVLTHNSENS